MRRLILEGCYRTGLWNLWRRRNTHAIVILTVHGVMDETTPHDWVPLRSRLSPRRLDEALGILKRHYSFASLGDAVDMLAGRTPARPNTIVLTFDDGYRNHVTHALPILRKHNVPATVFVSTGHVDSRQPFWFDRLDYALQHVTESRDVAVDGHAIPLRAGDRPALKAAYADLRTRAKMVRRDDRQMNAELDALAQALEAESGHRLMEIVETDPWSAVLTRAEIRTSAADVAFGSHTVDHLRVHRLPREVVVDQLSRSRQAIEEWTGTPCRFFCYPDGGVNAESASLAAECGYAAAVTTVRGVNRIGDDLMHLKRIDVPEHGGAAELLAEVSGLLDALLSLRAQGPGPKAQGTRPAQGSRPKA